MDPGRVGLPRSRFWRFWLAFVGAATSFLLGRPLQAQALYKIETSDHRLIFYDKAQTFLAPHLMSSFEKALQFHKQTFDYKPTQKVTTLLEDFGDYGHGGADIIPANHIDFGIAPFSYVYEVMPSYDRLAWMMNHETFHIAEMDSASHTDRFLRSFFRGKVSPTPDDPISMGFGYLTTPRRYSPRWFHEGLAVFMETWMGGGIGRTLGGYDEMVFRTLVRDQSRIYDVVGLEAEGTTTDFQVGANSYLYGTRFVSFLANNYGPEKIVDWIARRDDTKSYFAAEFQKVFGQSLKDEWSRWIQSEREWQNDNLTLIRQFPVTPMQRILDQPVGSVSRAYYDSKDKTVYVAVRSTGQMAHLAAIDLKTGNISRLHDVEGPALYYVCSLAFDPTSRTIFYTIDNNNWRDLMALNVDTHETKKLISNARTGDLVFNTADKSLWGTRHNNGLSAIVRAVPPYESFEVVWAYPYGTDLYDLDISPDGKSMSAALVDLSGRQKLVLYDLEKLSHGDGQFEVLHDFDYSSPANFVFSPEGRYLYGTSYETGVSNIFRIDLQGNNEIAAFSNAETGLFRPVPLKDGSLLAFEYTANGMIPVTLDAKPIQDANAVKYLGQQIVDKYPVVKQWKLDPRDSVDLAALTTGAGRYNPAREMKLMSVYPTVQGYKNGAAAGAHISFSDDLGLSGLETTMSYSPDSSLRPSERGHVGFNYHYWDWKISGFWNNADFYDLFGPTKTSRKGYAAKLEHTKHLLYKPPTRTLDWNWSVGGYFGLEALPDYQNVPTANISRFVTAKSTLRYEYLERSLGAVDDEKGIRWEAGSTMTAAASKAFPQIYGNLDYGFLTALDHSPVWFRVSAGRSFGDRNEPFGNFYFGGFGNNWIDHQDVSRYRLYSSFPGVDLNQIGVHDYTKALVEWNLPPIRFSRLGSTYASCNWARFSLFSSGLAGNMGLSTDRQLRANLGAQLDFRFVLFSYLNSTLSLGYARATGAQAKRPGEFMISLKLL
jgi:hypothetical protein